MNLPPMQPSRLFEDPTAESRLRGDLVHAREAELQGFDVGRGAEALQAALAQELPVTASGIKGVLLTEILIAGVIGLGVGLAGWAATRSSEGHARDESQAMVEPAKVAALVPSEARTPVDAAVPVDPPTLPRTPAPAAAATVIEPETRDPHPAPPSERRTRANVGSTVGRPEVARTSAAETQAPSTDRDPFAAVLREAELVSAARRALADDPARALALTEDAAHEFPEGQLVQEREALAIRALARLGALDRARLRADGFLERYARGPHAAAVRRAVGLEPQ